METINSRSMIGMAVVLCMALAAKEVLKENKVAAPVAVRAFPITLGHFSSRLAEK